MPRAFTIWNRQDVEQEAAPGFRVPEPKYPPEMKLSERRRVRSKETRDFVDEMKSAPCMDCGRTFPPVAMDFDHVRGEKAFSISKRLMAKRETILVEIAKCDLVCSNCHRIRTHERRGGGV